MFRFIYSVVFYLITPLIILRLVIRGLAAPNYRKRWGQRFGFFTPSESSKETIWLHAVSVGETLAAVPLVKALQEKYPERRLLITCMTPTGSERITAAFGDSVDHSYAPYDTPDAVARFLKRVQPKMLIIMETELWPNTVAACYKRQIPVILANGRLSEKSARGYARVSKLSGPMVAQLSAVAAQHGDDGGRFIALGLPVEKLHITGNIKFDLELNAQIRLSAEALRQQWDGTNQRPVLLAASTHRGEDEIILQAFSLIKQSVNNALLVLVPRHPERFNQVGDLCLDAGYSLARRSNNDSTDNADILLGDTMGELMTFFGACDIAFVGGSLVSNGGHNMIEPAAWGKPTLSGLSVFNFAEVSRLLAEAGGLSLVEDAAALAESVIVLMKNPEQAQQMGLSAQQVAEANRGALERLLAVIDNSLSQ
ncbi:3-deoxy-D-manno-octulosonic-acid transferase [marine gamma proteobacterium HTCC2207]|uniref:3-deoxy-D-manno-octulosonic acid transferase n=1 Tax=gamma proteobacterium HTCC2207 TaxID=314287 RepID=Q1YUP8_9GAMM|nr:3-deoxy-D-manno-octulosonic-acid transferase [marine gamma proteobacterium HTCC2207] [gamma proteobacterium HTCC2207]